MMIPKVVFNTQSDIYGMNSEFLEENKSYILEFEFKYIALFKT